MNLGMSVKIAETHRQYHCNFPKHLNVLLIHFIDQRLRFKQEYKTKKQLHYIETAQSIERRVKI